MPIEAWTRRSRMSMASMIATDYRIPAMQTALIDSALVAQGTLVALAGYLLGSISFAIVVSRLMTLPDPRSYGSKNPGATNVLRSGSKAAAVLTLAGDAGKGWLAVWLAWVWAGDAALAAGGRVGGFSRPLLSPFHPVQRGEKVGPPPGPV